MEISQIQKTTEKFYAKLCCIDNFDNYNGKIVFICSDERNEFLNGFGCKFILYCLKKENLAIITYSPILKARIQKIKEIVTFDNLEEILINTFPEITKHTLMIFDNQIDIDYKGARILVEDDYESYEEFFKRQNPNVKSIEWLKEYFIEKVKLQYFVGYYKDTKLVSLCDAPDMPYMQNIIQHTGISTILSERRKGYAKKVCALATRNLINRGVCPQWETSFNNTASIKLAESIGYKLYANAYIIRSFE